MKRWKWQLVWSGNVSGKVDIYADENEYGDWVKASDAEVEIGKARKEGYDIGCRSAWLTTAQAKEEIEKARKEGMAAGYNLAMGPLVSVGAVQDQDKARADERERIIGELKKYYSECGPGVCRGVSGCIDLIRSRGEPQWHGEAMCVCDGHGTPKTDTCCCPIHGWRREQKPCACGTIGLHAVTPLCHSNPEWIAPLSTLATGDEILKKLNELIERENAR